MMGVIPSIFILLGITIMNEDEKKIIARFEINARPVDRVAYIMAREQLGVLQDIRKDIDKVRKEVVQLRAEVKKELTKRIDDGK